MNEKITAILNQKGGVGKTTTSQNIGAGLANKKKKKTLLIDLDPQGNLSQAFGIDKAEYTVLEALLQHGDEVKPYIINDNLHLLAANDSLSRLEVQLNSEDYSNIKFEAGGEHYVLKMFLDDFGKGYEHIILDCPPSLNILSVNAIAATNQVMIPMEAQKYSVKGLEMVINIMNKIKKKINPELKLAGMFFTRHNPNIVIKADTSKQIQEVVGDKLYHTFIRSNVAIEEASQFNMDIFSYDEYLTNQSGRKVCSNGAKDYAALLEEFLGNEIKLESRHLKNELTEAGQKEALTNPDKDLGNLNREFQNFNSKK